MGSVELMGWVAVGAGVLFPFSWIPAAVCAGINEKRRLHQGSGGAGAGTSAPAADDDLGGRR